MKRSISSVARVLVIIFLITTVFYASVQAKETNNRIESLQIQNFKVDISVVDAAPTTSFTPTVLPTVTPINTLTPAPAPAPTPTPIIFGSYPQTKVTDSTLLANLQSQIIDVNGDTTLNGSKYKKVFFTKYFSTSQSGNGYLINTEYWFKYEPISWRVLSNTNGKTFVISENILDTKQYNQTFVESTWETCSLRSWLNNSFYNSAFSASEKTQIATTNVDNKDTPWVVKEGGDDTSDMLFLLSYYDSINPVYGFNSSFDKDDSARRAKGSDFSKCQGLMVLGQSGSFTGFSNWWLRTPMRLQNGAGNIFAGGFGGYSLVHGTSLGVRPVFVINASEVKIPVSSISLSKSSASLIKGKTLQLNAKISPSNATTNYVTWASSNSAVASVSVSGLVTTKSIGSVNISCTANDGSNKKALCTIKVFPAIPASFQAKKASSTSVQLTWKAVPGATGYTIYRYNSSKKIYSTIASVTTLKYMNKKLAKNATYRYKIDAFCTVKGIKYYSSFTSIKTVKI